MKSQELLDKINRHIIGEEEIKRVNDVLKSGFLARPDGGPQVRELQNLVSKWLGQKYVFGVTSGTAALHSAIVGLGLKKGDEVIVPALANIADCSVVIQEDATPVFADIDPQDFNLDPDDVYRKITKNTKAIIVVHMFGQPAKLDRLIEIANEKGIIVIEDCAQAAGAKYKGKPVGSYGSISCFSLYQTKHIISGEGGIVATQSPELAKIITSITNNGVWKDDLDAYDYDRLGYNYQLSEVQGALAIEQLKKLDQNNDARRKNVELFKQHLSDVDVTFQKENDDTKNVYFYLTGLLPQGTTDDKRNHFMQLVKEGDTPIKKLYPLSLPEVKLLKNDYPQDCPIAAEVSKRLFNLYVNPGLDPDDIEFMAGAIKKAFKEIYK
ncbi:MAG: DegT/DnrJ/EryC1/StrS family aminotransferase [Candidatus Komeilibacteria bacterium]